ncbi:dockerin type I domain-containing protein [Herbivorax sp. ANBcel31]|uniref:dockerin type I domain-containing protein n=1 Tax=Herbivorax sp. ANBcel31 TaxID=3069754 RepID=UPI0027B5EEF0|nr:dockerin type I domain-containing protein [Herbivorax sp. ANBcel31]MDQ2086581.1 dockerin type I domain-containing protein [Herbivorax sp. ANBcel31]
MINSIKKNFSAFLVFAFLFINIIFNTVTVYAKEPAKTITNYKILNPYESVEWHDFNQYKANFHTHTTESDGENSPKEMIEYYYRIGYDILAITDHDFISTSWDRNDRNPDDYLTTERLNEINIGFGRNSRGMKNVPFANEQSMNINHLNTFWTKYNNSCDATLKDNIANCEKTGGISHINHPINDNANKYINLFLKYPSCVGIEMLNYRHGNMDSFINTWDTILSATMPERPVWGFSNDDSHCLDEIGFNFNMMIMPENTEENIRFSMENGTFYTVTLYVQNRHNKSPNAKGSFPTIKNIEVDSEMNSITITGENYHTIQWIADNKVISTGQSINLNNHQDKINNYVRAKLKGSHGLSYSQPFGIIEKSQILLGDINSDGIVDLSDYVLLIKHLSGINKYHLSGEKLLAADVTNTGSLDLEDLEYMKNYLLDN